MGEKTRAFVTLATNDDYAQGAVALGTSLRNSKTSHSLVIFVSATVGQHMRELLCKIWDEVITTETISSNDRENLVLLSRPELGITLTKLRAWTLTKYQKCVFMDADTLVLCNVDELFGWPEFSAARDTGWPDCFNSGVFVLEPSLETYDQLLNHMVKEGSFDGGDQGLLNTFFGSKWQRDLRYHLPFTYNMVASVSYTYAPALRQYGNDMKVVHFLGSTKPWHYTYNSSDDSVSGMPLSGMGIPHDLTCKWWNVYLSAKHTNKVDYADTLACDVATLSLHEQVQQPEITAEERDAVQKRRWEEGKMDYTGEDKFANIQKQLDRSMSNEDN